MPVQELTTDDPRSRRKAIVKAFADHLDEIRREEGATGLGYIRPISDFLELVAADFVELKAAHVLLQKQFADHLKDYASVKSNVLSDDCAAPCKGSPGLRCERDRGHESPHQQGTMTWED